MRFEEVKHILSSWNPSSYRKQIVVKQKIIFRHVLFAIILSLLLMLLISLPLLIHLPRTIAEKATSFSELNLSVQFSTSQSVELSKIPRVVVNSEQENISHEKVLMNKEGIIINKHFGKEDKLFLWSDLNSAQNIVREYARSIQILIILLLPSLLILLLILSILEAGVLILLSVLIMKFLSFFSQRNISFSSLLKLSTLAVIPFFMIQLIPFMYIRWWSIPLLAYVLIIISAYYFVSEKKDEFHREKKKQRKKKKKKSREIVFSEDYSQKHKNDDNE